MIEGETYLGYVLTEHLDFCFDERDHLTGVYFVFDTLKTYNLLPRFTAWQVYNIEMRHRDRLPRNKDPFYLSKKAAEDANEAN